jgi:isopenicillin N synthase-like dioxygenase
MPTTVLPFVQKSLQVNQTILNIFNSKLGLPEGALSNLHSLDEQSGCEARIIKNPPMPHNVQKRAIGAHTDFGSLVSSPFDSRIIGTAF